MPSITAMRKCPDLIFVKPRFDAYKAVSLQIRDIFAEYSRKNGSRQPDPTPVAVYIASVGKPHFGRSGYLR
jgi:hypothetical protein